MIQISIGVTVEKCTINTFTELPYETDGIHMNNSQDLIVKNNYIKIINNGQSYTGPTPPAQNHSDVIQADKGGDAPNLACMNVTIMNNTCINGSTNNHLPGDEAYAHRQGIYVNDESRGFVRVIGNNLVSYKGNGLIHCKFGDETTELKIYNNTLVGLENMFQLLEVNKLDAVSVNRLRIKNNIFHKNGVSGGLNQLNAIKFIQITTNDITNEILNYNHYNNSFACSTCATINFNGTSLAWKDPQNRWEPNGSGGDPLFNVINENYSIQIHSPVKNSGITLPEVIEDINGEVRPYWVNGVDKGAFELREAQIRIGVINGSNPSSIQHKLTVYGTYWEKDGDTWIISENPNLANITYSAEQYSSDKEEWNGFHFNWMRTIISNEKPIAHGFYKLSNNLDSFYIDMRDAVFSGYNPNIYIKFDNTANILKYYYYKNNIGIK